MFETYPEYFELVLVEGGTVIMEENYFTKDIKGYNQINSTERD